MTIEGLEHGAQASCPRCAQAISQPFGDATVQVLSYGVTSIILLLLALQLPFLSISAAGASNQISLWNSAWAYSEAHMPLLGALVSITMLVIPALLLLLVLAVFIPFALRYPAPWLRLAGRWLFHLQEWCMADVFLLATVVSLTKLYSLAHIQLGAGFWCYLGFTLSFTLMFSRLDRLQLWQTIQQLLEPDTSPSRKSASTRSCHHCYQPLTEDCVHCPRCHTHNAPLHNRLQQTLALLITATLLYIPANLLPIMTTIKLGQEHPSTILGGVRLLMQMGSYPVALVIFCASVLVPLAKLFALYYLCWQAKRPSNPQAKQQTRLFAIAEFMGKWSMVDVFVVAVLISLVQMHQLMSVTPGMAATAFSSVVIFTMLAAQRFDTRLLWQANAQQTSTQEASSKKTRKEHQG